MQIMEHMHEISLHKMQRSFNPDPELSKVCSELWGLDENRLTPGVDYAINLQGGKEGGMRLACSLLLESA